MEYHVPVLLNESISALNIKKDGIYVDCTLGGGGHSEAILSHLTTGRLISIDQDIDAINFAKNRLKSYSNVTFIHDNFKNIEKILFLENIDKVDGILIDLGVSSYQLDTADRGFSYRYDADLDMRMDRREKKTAKWVVNNLTFEELRDIFFKYGEERNSNAIARNIVKFREIESINTTNDLVKIIKLSFNKRQLKHPAKKIFQALRIYVNNEMEVIENIIDAAIDLLNINGRLAIITFHSLEDRIVKQKFKYLESDCICPSQIPMCKCDKISKISILTKKPIIPTDIEINKNLRAHSSKLRIAERKE